MSFQGLKGSELKSEPLKEAYSFGNSTLFLTPEGGIQQALPLQDDFINANASADEIYAVIKDRSLISKSEPQRERVNLEKFVYVALPQNLQGRFPYNEAIVCMLNPAYENQSIYVSRDITFEKDDKTLVIPANTELSIPKGRLVHREFPDHTTNFINLPLVTSEDIPVKVLA